MGPGSMLSMASEYSLASAATVWNHNASVPANGPRPTHTAKMMAHSSVSMERMMLRSVRTTK